ncbi:MAG: Hachiman antiphage defense system protein HamA [Clostridium sp.]
MNPKHIEWFESFDEINLSDGNIIKVYNFNYGFSDDIMNGWANYFRNHYCLDEEIDFFRDGTGLSKEDYLLEMKFPDRSRSFGPATRSGDFAEILVADYLEYILNHYVPRTRYDRKTVRNESIKGCDVLGFIINDPSEAKADDCISIFEVKAKFSGTNKENRLQDAVNDSVKDPFRVSESLNAIKQRLFDKRDIEGCNKISRFQNKVDNPYQLNLGAVAMVNEALFDKDIYSLTDVSNHDKAINLIVIKGVNMMELVHELYRRASKC